MDKLVDYVNQLTAIKLELESVVSEIKDSEYKNHTKILDIIDEINKLSVEI